MIDASNTCSCRSVTGCRESIPLSNDDGSNAQDTHNGEVDKSRLRGAVEGVVQPRHKGAHDQESNAWVVQSEMKDMAEIKGLTSLAKINFIQIWRGQTSRS